jgi:hypothetical protein
MPSSPYPRPIWDKYTEDATHIFMWPSEAGSLPCVRLSNFSTLISAGFRRVGDLARCTRALSMHNRLLTAMDVW